MAENKIGSWNEREEVEWLNYTIQPPLSMVKGEYYLVKKEFGMATWAPGHHGSLEVVKDKDGKFIFVEFNEICMDKYYCHYFSKIDKRRSDYGIWQASKVRQAKAGVVIVNGMQQIESQVMERQSFEGEFDLLTGASASMRQMLPMAKEMALIINQPSSKRLYSYAENFGFGITGWLKVVVEDGKVTSCKYDEVFADHQADIAYPELKKYYKQSKCNSPCFEEPFPPGWNIHAWLIGFKDIMEILNQHVVETQNLLDIEGLPHVEGEDLGFVWDRESIWDRPIQPYVKGNPRPRHPAWNNYLKLANVVTKEMENDGYWSHL